jgi:predicted hydrocarbon binding protein
VLAEDPRYADWRADAGRLAVTIVLSVVAKKRAGMLAQIAVEVFRADCQLVDQKMAASGDPETYDLTLVLEGPASAAGRVMAGLRALDGVFTVLDGSPPSPSAPAAPLLESRRAEADNLETRLQAAFVEVVDAFPHVVGPVQRFANSLTGATRREAVFRLGQRTGRREYKRSFSLGSPLKLEPALRRMLVPALRPFVKAVATDSMLSVPDCPFCINLQTAEPCCDFLRGFLQGFLDVNPGTPGLRVAEVRCKACGHAECGFSCTAARR